MNAKERLSDKDIAEKEKLVKLLELNIDVKASEKRVDVFGCLKNDTENDIEIPKYYVTFFKDGSLNRNCFDIRDSDGKRVPNFIDSEDKLAYYLIWNDCVTIPPKGEYDFLAPSIQNSYAINGLDYFTIVLTMCGIKSNLVTIDNN